MGILHALIAQSKNPSGMLGRAMLHIMNNAHKNMTLWGLSYLQHGGNILDAGCGGGNAIYLMAKAGMFERIVGIDSSRDAVSIAVAKNQKQIAKGLVTITQASVLELPFEDNTFEAATTFQSHYHWPSVLEAFREINRVLKPGGQFLLVAETSKITYHMKQYNDAQGTIDLFGEGGFTNITYQIRQKCICVSGYKDLNRPTVSV